MKRVLLDKNYLEQIRIFTKLNDTKAYNIVQKRLVELAKKKYEIVETSTEGDEQCFILQINDKP